MHNCTRDLKGKQKMFIIIKFLWLFYINFAFLFRTEPRNPVVVVFFFHNYMHTEKSQIFCASAQVDQRI